MVAHVQGVLLRIGYAPCRFDRKVACKAWIDLTVVDLAGSTPPEMHASLLLKTRNVEKYDHLLLKCRRKTKSPPPDFLPAMATFLD